MSAIRQRTGMGEVQANLFWYHLLDTFPVQALPSGIASHAEPAVARSTTTAANTTITNNTVDTDHSVNPEQTVLNPEQTVLNPEQTVVNNTIDAEHAPIPEQSAETASGSVDPTPSTPATIPGPNTSAEISGAQQATPPGTAQKKRKLAELDDKVVETPKHANAE
jgi:hypothetical protein